MTILRQMVRLRLSHCPFIVPTFYTEVSYWPKPFCYQYIYITRWNSFKTLKVSGAQIGWFLEILQGGGRRGQRPLGESPGFPNTVPQVQKQRFKSLNPDAWDVSHAEFVHHLTYQLWVTCICTAPIHLNSIKSLKENQSRKLFDRFDWYLRLYWWALDFWGTLGSGSCS